MLWCDPERVAGRCAEHLHAPRWRAGGAPIVRERRDAEAHRRVRAELLLPQERGDAAAVLVEEHAPGLHLELRRLGCAGRAQRGAEARVGLAAGAELVRVEGLTAGRREAREQGRVALPHVSRVRGGRRDALSLHEDMRSPTSTVVEEVSNVLQLETRYSKRQQLQSLW